MLVYKLLPYISPNLVIDLVKDQSGTIFLDSNMENVEYGRYSFIGINPLITFSSIDKIDFKQQILEWSQLFSQIKLDFPELPPFIGGLAGYLSYDLSKEFEQIPNNESHQISEIPTYMMGLYNQIFAFDNMSKTCHIIVTKIPGYEINCDLLLTQLYDLYNASLKQNLTVNTDNYLPKIQLISDFTQEGYIKAVNQVINHILNGDIFEANLSQRFSAALPDKYPIFSLYKKLQKINSAPFSAYLNLGDFHILSSSPERFIAIKDQYLETRPIKGTIKKQHDGQSADLDSAAYILANSEKDRAENIMVVDMLRSDLSKICEPKSIHVTKLCGVESFTNLHHLVSVIIGKLKDSYTIFDIIPSCFPGASITGAPKVRAMEIIEELEPCNREIYCGSIGYFSFNGNVDLSIAIRTIVIQQNTLNFNVGGAITLDSDPLAEYQETLAKGEKLSEAINDINY